MGNNVIRRAKVKIRTEFKGMKLLTTNKNIVLMITEDYGNYGDLHLAESELEFLEHYFPEYRITEIPASRYWWEIKQIRKYIRKTDIIFLQGGGNIGDQYPGSRQRRRDILAKFPDNPIFIFPQTIYYSNMDGEELQIDKEEMSSHKNLHLFTREKYSYEFGKKYFPMDISLFPDIVLFSRYNSNKHERSGVLVCLRDDRETNLQEQDRTYIAQVCGKHFKQVIHTDTVEPDIIPIEKRRGKLDSKIEEFRKASMVVTDRLHGMVFSAVTGTPCIVLPNYNQKIKGGYHWLKNVNYITFVENLDELDEKITEMKAVIAEMDFDFTPEFDKMRDKIKRELGEA